MFIKRYESHTSIDTNYSVQLQLPMISFLALTMYAQITPLVNGMLNKAQISPLVNGKPTFPHIYF